MEKKVISLRTVQIRRITAKRGIAISVANQVTWQKIVRVVFAQDIIGASRRIIVGAIGGGTSQSTKMTTKVKISKISKIIDVIRVKSSNNH